MSVGKDVRSLKGAVGLPSGKEQTRAGGDGVRHTDKGAERDVTALEDQLSHISLEGEAHTSAESQAASKQEDSKALIYFDLEATGLARTSHITQIAAVRNEDTFMRYVMPKMPIDKGAEKVTGIQVRDGVMYQHGKEVKAIGIKDALTQFIAFITETKHNHLIGHNIKSFDCPVLMNALRACDMDKTFGEGVEGCVDTLKLFRLSHPGRSKYNQTSLVQDLVGKEYGAHDALEDVKALRMLVDHVGTNVFDDKYESARFDF